MVEKISLKNISNVKGNILHCGTYEVLEERENMSDPAYLEMID